MKYSLLLFFLLLSTFQHVEGSHPSQKKVKPYLLPKEHPLKPSLEAIFSQKNVLKNIDTFTQAGFTPLHFQPTTHIIVARHPLLPGYLVKLYLETEKDIKEGKESWEWFLARCQAAENIRKLIKKKKLKHFTVPNKWLYQVATPEEKRFHPYILVVTDMNIVDLEASKQAWKTIPTKEHLKELYTILSHGYSSCLLPFNIPFTHSGTFSCIDTEHPKRKLKYERVKEHLSPEMQRYWDKLIKGN